MKRQKHLPPLPIGEQPREDGLWMLSRGRWHEIVNEEVDDEEDGPAYGEDDPILGTTTVVGLDGESIETFEQAHAFDPDLFPDEETFKKLLG